MATVETQETQSHVIKNSPHNLVIRRTQTTQNTTQTRTRESSTKVRPVDIQFTEGDYSLVTAKGVSDVKENRENERKELQDLNDRFSNYLDKVRNLEAQNRKLADDLEKMKSKWGKETSQIKAMYQAELDEARRTLDDAEKEKARLEIKVASLEEQIEEIRIKLAMVQQELAFNSDVANRQTQQITEYEHEIQLLRKQLEALESEHSKDQATIANLEAVLQKTREDLDVETLAHIDAENRRQTLEEEIEFLKSIHDKEVKELAALAYRDTTPESRDFWKNELAQAIREIEQMYGEKLEDMKVDLEASNNRKLQEFRTGSARQSTEVNKTKEDCKDLRNAVTDIRDKINDLDARNQQLMREIEALRRQKDDRERDLEAENAALRDEANGIRFDLDAVMRELQGLLGTKMTLDLEIAAYRKLLEYEENRTGARPKDDNSRPDNGYSNDPSANDGIIGKGEMSAKTTYSRTAKGSMAVADCPPDGRFVRLENTGRREENIQGYKIQRNVDGKVQPPYVLNERFKSFQPGQKIAIWAKGCLPQNAPSKDIEMNEVSWGIGSNVVTTLVNADGEDRASLTQKTTYS